MDNAEIENQIAVQTDNNSMEKDKNKSGTYLALGLIFGCALGAIFNNIALFVSAGIIIGVIMEGLNK